MDDGNTHQIKKAAHHRNIPKTEDIVEQKFFPHEVKRSQDGFTVPTWSILLFLCVFFFILKSFIYIKDEKRHGK